MPNPRLVWLFDIDGTLLLTDGAAREAFSTALRACLDLEVDLSDVAFAGRTDPLILTDILRKHDRELRDGERERFWEAVCDAMKELLVPGRGRLLPGVTELLQAIALEPQWVAALLTGNTTPMARLKLGHFGLQHRFAFGAFGEEAENRDALARVAVARALKTTGVPPDRCVVVGDTELDIQCARAAGARVVAVATGVRSRSVLAERNPDLLLDDLSEPRALLDWARAVAAGDLGFTSRP